MAILKFFASIGKKIAINCSTIFFRIKSIIFQKLIKFNVKNIQMLRFQNYQNNQGTSEQVETFFRDSLERGCYKCLAIEICLI